MNKRSTALLLAIALLVVALGSNAFAQSTKVVWAVKSKDETKLGIWHGWEAEYEKLHPDVDVELINPPGSYYATMKTWMAGGEGADIMWMGYAFFDFVDYLMPLDELYAKDADIREIAPNMINAHSWQGQLFAVPYGVNTHAIYYNKDLLANAGLSMPSHWTWDDAIEMAKRMTKDTNGDGANEQWGLNLYWDTHWRNYGEESVYGADGRTITIDNPVVTTAVQLWADLQTGKFGVQNPSASLNALLNGQAAMGNRGTFDVPKFRDVEGLDWDVAEFPWLEVGGNEYYSTFCSAETWTIWKGTKNPAVAKDFLRFIMSRERNAAMGAAGTTVPTQASAAVASFLKNDEPKHIRVFMDNLAHWDYGQYGHPAYGDVKSFWGGDTWKKIMSGETAARVGIPEMARQLQTALDDWWATADKK